MEKINPKSGAQEGDGGVCEDGETCRELNVSMGRRSALWRARGNEEERQRRKGERTSSLHLQ